MLKFIHSIWIFWIRAISQSFDRHNILEQSMLVTCGSIDNVLFFFYMFQSYSCSVFTYFLLLVCSMNIKWDVEVLIWIYSYIAEIPILRRCKFLIKNHIFDLADIEGAGDRELCIICEYYSAFSLLENCSERKLVRISNISPCVEEDRCLRMLEVSYALIPRNNIYKFVYHGLFFLIR